MNYGNQGKCVSTPNDTSSWTPVKDMWVYCDKNTYNGIRENPTQITKIDSRNIWCKDIRGESYLSADRFKSQYRPAFPHEIPQQEVLPSSATSNKRVEDLKYMDVVHIETEEEYNRVCKLNKIISEYKSGFKYYLMKGGGGLAEKRISYENCGYTIYEMNQLIFNEVKPVKVDMNAILEEARKKYPIGCTIATLDGKDCKLLGHDFLVHNFTVYATTGIKDVVYREGIWAKIVSLPQTKEPYDSVLVKTQEEYNYVFKKIKDLNKCNEEAFKHYKECIVYLDKRGWDAATPKLAKNSQPFEEWYKEQGYNDFNPIIQKLEEITKDWEPNVTKFCSPLNYLLTSSQQFTFTGIGELNNQGEVFDASGVGILYTCERYAQKVEEKLQIPVDIKVNYIGGMDRDFKWATLNSADIMRVGKGDTITLNKSWFDDGNTNKIRTWKEYGDMFSKYYVGTDPVNTGLEYTNKLTKAAQKKSISLDTKDYDSKSINQELKLKKVNKQKSTIKFY